MEVWGSYALADFLLFSPQAYFRQFALINETAVPLPVLLHGLAAALLWLSGSSIPWRRRAVLIGLAVLWASSAWLFHWRSYAAINWVAPWFAAGFALQSGILLWRGAATDIDRERRSSAGISLTKGVALACVILYPLQAALFERPWREAELIGVSPDATALFTAAMVVLLAPQWRWLLLVAPTVWLAVGLLTLGTMGAPEVWTLSALFLVLVAALIADRKDRGAGRSSPAPED
ncbi:MAG: DUF6064 family protein [Reyranellaceae bacterium]